jgi:hypothetical protein
MRRFFSLFRFSAQDGSGEMKENQHGKDTQVDS